MSRGEWMFSSIWILRRSKPYWKIRPLPLLVHDFPWAYPNEIDFRHFNFNFEGEPLFQNKDVRWALALALNIVELQTEYIGGVAKLSAIR